MNNWEEEEYNEREYIPQDKANPRSMQFDIGVYNTQNFKCPECGSYNTSQGTYYEQCNSCGWSQGY